MSEWEKFSFDPRFPETEEILEMLKQLFKQDSNKIFKKDRKFEREFTKFLRCDAPDRITDKFILKLYEKDVVSELPYSIRERFPVTRERVAFAIEEVCRQMPYIAKKFLYALEQSSEQPFIIHILRWLTENYPNSYSPAGNEKDPFIISSAASGPTKGVTKIIDLADAVISLRRLIQYCSESSEALENLRLNSVTVTKVKGRITTHLQYGRLPPALPSFPKLRVVNLHIHTEKSVGNIFNMKQMKSLLFFIPAQFRQHGLWKAGLDELKIQINGQTYVKVLNPEGRTAVPKTLLLNRWGRFDTDKYLQDAGPDLEVLYCALLPLTLDRLKQCTNLTELNLFNCDFIEHATTGQRRRDSARLPHNEETAKMLTQALTSLNHLQKVTIDFGLSYGYFDLGIVTTEGNQIQRLTVGHCKIISELDGTESELDGTESELDGTESELDGTESELDGTESKLDGTESGLEEAFKNFRGEEITFFNCESSVSFFKDFIVPRNHEDKQKLVTLVRTEDGQLETRVIKELSWNLMDVSSPGYSTMSTEDKDEYCRIFNICEYDEPESWPYRIRPPLSSGSTTTTGSSPP